MPTRDQTAARLFAALDSALGGEYRAIPLDRTATVRLNAQRLAALYGSGRKAAKALGIPESTFRGWRHGIIPKNAQIPAILFQQIRQQMRTRSTTFQQAWNGTITLSLKGIIQQSRDKRRRTIHPGRVIPLYMIRSVLQAWLDGKDEDAGKLLLKAIDTYYQPFRYHTIDRVWFE